MALALGGDGVWRALSQARVQAPVQVHRPVREEVNISFNGVRSYLQI